MIFRAINVQLAHRDQCTRRAVVIVAALLGLDMPVDRARDRLIRAAGLMLVDHRPPFAVGQYSAGPSYDHRWIATVFLKNRNRSVTENDGTVPQPRVTAHGQVRTTKPRYISWPGRSTTSCRARDVGGGT